MKRGKLLPMIGAAIALGCIVAMALTIKKSKRIRNAVTTKLHRLRPHNLNKDLDTIEAGI